ncbi:MAG: Na+/H+ antiporter NhaC family protein [Verrucomicrobiota bacterium]
MNDVAPNFWKMPRRWMACLGALAVVCLILSLLPTGPLSDEAKDGQGHWSSLLPPLVAVIVAISFRSLVAALSSAFLTGAVLYYGLNPLIFIPKSINEFLFANIFGQFSLYIFGFLFTLVGMIHVLYKSGGIQGLVDLFSKMAKGARSAQIATLGAGFMVFFDDYSNTIVVGQTMRSLTDRWKISREKLAYLVDSTTAPIAGLAVVSTWIAYEVWLLGSTARGLGLESGGYAIFVQMLPMRFYCWGTLIFLVGIVLLQRDFGPMLKAERRARSKGQLQAPDARPLLHENPKHLEPPEGIPHRWYNAAIPLITVLFSVIGGILYVGTKRLARDGEAVDYLSLTGLQDIFGIVVYDPTLHEGGPGVPMVLFWAAIAGGVVAIALPVFQKLLTTADAARSYSGSLPTLGVTLFIVPMAWAMKTICESLGTSYYLLSLVGDSLPVVTVPLLTFILAAGMAFSMGTSWGTMGVMIPIMLPFVWKLGADDPMQMTLFILTSAAVLDGAIFGDHCSPISDTTVLSSIATGCDHLHHVGTQLPYALTTMLLASVLGYTLIAFTGLGPWVYFLLFPVTAFSIIRIFGRKAEP